VEKLLKEGKIRVGYKNPSTNVWEELYYNNFKSISPDKIKVTSDFTNIKNP